MCWSNQCSVVYVFYSISIHTILSKVRPYKWLAPLRTPLSFSIYGYRAILIRTIFSDSIWVIGPSFWYNWNAILYRYISRTIYIFSFNSCFVYEVNATTIFSCGTASCKTYWIYIFSILAITVYEYLCHPYEVTFSVIRGILQPTRTFLWLSIISRFSYRCDFIRSLFKIRLVVSILCRIYI
jgi:hypothetical protein